VSVCCYYCDFALTASQTNILQNFSFVVVEYIRVVNQVHISTGFDVNDEKGGVIYIYLLFTQSVVKIT